MAPTQDAPVIRFNAEEDKRQLDLMRWGLVPSWATDIKIGAQCINARAETMATKSAFKQAFAKGRRCIVPANGFFEWKKTGGTKQPMFIVLKSGARMGFAPCQPAAAGRRRKPDGRKTRTSDIPDNEGA
jgi:putative SOS response-associated peptidase YedK